MQADLDFMKPVCPLCKSEKIFNLKLFDLATLRNEWQKSFGFDPFSEFNPVADTLRQHRCNRCDLEFFSPQYVGSAAFYERLSKAEWYYEDEKWEFDEAIRRLGNNPTINTLLEIGCGNGCFLEKVASCYEAHGNEINEQAVLVCKSKKLNVTTDRLETIGQTFDAVVSFEVLEHVPNPDDFLGKMISVLSPQGTLIIGVPNPEGSLKEMGNVLLDMPPHHATRWSVRAFEYVAREYGLQLVGVANEPLRYVHYQQYLAMLAATYHRQHHGALSKQRKRRLTKIFFPTMEGMIKILVPSLESVIRTQGYQQHKQLLKGQTHLAEFRKI